jgi:transcriptional regulator with XRE-family HTH domain
MVGMNLQQRLRSRREARGLRNSQVARTLGISTAHVSDMESGKSKPSLELLARLADLYATSTDYLLGLTDDPTPVGRGEPPSPYVEKLTNLARRLSEINTERLLALGDALYEHEQERARLARERSATLKMLTARIGREQAALFDELIAAAVASGDTVAIFDALVRGGLLPPEDV